VGLANPAYLQNSIPVKGEAQGVVVCPGPNMAYFDKEVSLHSMARHIYGNESVLAKGYRPNMFIKELQLYADYFTGEVNKESCMTTAQAKKWNTFKNNLLEGIAYYQNLFGQTNDFDGDKKDIAEKLDYYKTIVMRTEVAPCTNTMVNLPAFAV